MVADVNLKEIQRKVYMTFFQDGLWDIFLGLFILGWGLSILTEAAYLPGVFHRYIFYDMGNKEVAHLPAYRLRQV